MSIGEHPGEYEGEPVHGLPERLPAGEELLWQGSPSWRGLARRAFHVRKVMVYFGLLLGWSLISSLLEGNSIAGTARQATWILLPFSGATGILFLLAWLNGRATVYTITSRRIVIRFGVALQMALNLPFRTVQSVDLKSFADGTGDLSLRVSGAEQCGYMMLWPHARAWRFGSESQPTLRAIPDAEAIAGILMSALAASEQRTLAGSAHSTRWSEESGSPRRLVTAAS